MTNSIQDLFDYIVQKGSISQNSLIGCSQEEIESVQRHFCHKLPIAYKDFLRIAGKGAGRLFQGTDIFYPRILQLKSEAEDLLAEVNMPDLLPADANVFCMHQGYEIDYFLPTSDDPPVFQFVEGQPSSTRPWASLSDFFKESIESHLTQWQDLN